MQLVDSPKGLIGKQVFGEKLKFSISYFQEFQLNAALQLSSKKNSVPKQALPQNVGHRIHPGGLT